MSKTLLFDCDGVLLDTMAAVANFLRNELNVIVTQEEENTLYPQHWEFFKDKQDKIIDLLKEWQKTHHFAEIPSLKGAVEAIKKLKSSGYKLVIVTAAGTLKEAHENRLKNINKVFGEGTFEEIRYVDWTETKNNVLKEYEPTFFVEDTHHHAIEALELKHKPILIRHPQTADIFEDKKELLKDVKIFDTWEEITNYILQNK